MQAKRLLFVLFIMFFISACGGGETHTYPKTDGPDKNPMKGWSTGYWVDDQDASVGFQYIPWETMEPKNNEFDFAAVEDVIARPGSAGRHLILRLYCQWDGSEKDIESTACPTWLSTELGVKFVKGDDGRYFWDFNNHVFLDQANELIKAFGEHYDNDPRMFTIEFGILGTWGEWHTYSKPLDRDAYLISKDAKESIVKSYKKSFKNTHFAGRYPWDDVLDIVRDIGFHNDYFFPKDKHSNDFDQAVSDGKKWLGGPIVGETPEEAKTGLYTDSSGVFEGLSMIKKGHYSAMAPGAFRRVDGDPEYQEYMLLNKLMGYNFQIDFATFANETSSNGILPVAIEGSNIGVAPFYYNWNVDFALLDEKKNPVAFVRISDADIKKILPEKKFKFQAYIPLKNLPALPAKKYKLAIRIVQPDAEKMKDEAWKLDPRNVYIQFANELEVVPGIWDDKNAFIGGWSVLGDVVVKDKSTL